MNESNRQGAFAVANMLEAFFEQLCLMFPELKEITLQSAGCYNSRTLLMLTPMLNSSLQQHIK